MISRAKNKSYEIQGLKYEMINNLDAVKPNDSTGFLDQWPAYSSKRLVSSNNLILTKDKSIVVLNEKETKLPSLSPKPKFLEYLERYITAQLKKHGIENNEPSPMRLEIYREIFDWLIDAFKLYKPIFADIKREYDFMIAFLRDEIRKLEPLKEMIWTISEERNQEIIQIKKIENAEITNLKSEKAMLMKIIGEMEANEKTLEIQIETLQKKLEEEHLAFRNEADARRLLIIDINDIKQQIDDLSAIKKSQVVQSDDDPILTKMALEQAKKGHSELLMEITKMKTDYSEVVPKRDYDKLFEDHNALQIVYSENAKKISELDSEQQVLEEKFTALHQQRDFYYSKYMELSRSSTPRPEWKRCGDILSGGPQWWLERSKDKSSKELVDLLLQEINQSSSIKTQVEGKGMGNNVLPFLRAEGKINLRFMPKRDVKIHIRKIWDGRRILKEEQNEAISKNKDYILPSMADYVDLFYKKTYGIEQIRQEWAYSFYEFICKEKNDEKIIMFEKILNDEISEEAYWDEMININELLEIFRSKDTENKNLISKEDFRFVVKSLNNHSLNEEMVNKLIETVDKELLATDEHFLPYANLFTMNDEGEYGLFLTEVKRLYNEDKKKYIDEIIKEMRELGTKISPKEFRECLQIVDPQIPEEILNKYLLWCFGCKTVEDSTKMDPISLDVIVRKLNIGSIKRIGPRN